MGGKGGDNFKPLPIHMRIWLPVLAVFLLIANRAVYLKKEIKKRMQVNNASSNLFWSYSIAESLTSY
jgi:hypothetical protein